MTRGVAIISIIVGFLLLLLGYKWGKDSSKDKFITVSDTIIYIDTVFIDKPIAVAHTLIRKDTVVLSMVKTDTIHSVQVDSVPVVVPITQKKYSDTTYTAWVSGFNPNLDSIKVFNKNIVVHTTERIVKRNNWGLGVQVGVTYSGKQISPYIGVGVQKNFWSW